MTAKKKNVSSKGIEYVAGKRFFEGIDILFVGEKRLRSGGYPFPWEKIVIEPYCGVGRDFPEFLSANLVVGAFGYDAKTKKLLKNVYGYVGVQVFDREPGFFDRHNRTTECVYSVGNSHFVARDDSCGGYRVVEAWRALRMLDANDHFGQNQLSKALLLAGIGGGNYFKEGLGTFLSGLTVGQMKEILESFPPNLMEVYRYMMSNYAAFPSVSEMDAAIAAGHKEVKKYRQRVSIDTLDEKSNRKNKKTADFLNRLTKSAV